MQKGRLLQQSLSSVHSSILQQVLSADGQHDKLPQHSELKVQVPPSPVQQTMMLPPGWQVPLQH
jgi:hypothetical protein